MKEIIKLGGTINKWHDEFTRMNRLKFKLSMKKLQDGTFLLLVIALHAIKSKTPSENISVWIPRSLWLLRADRHASGTAPIPRMKTVYRKIIDNKKKDEYQPICNVAPLSTRLSAMIFPIFVSCALATPIFLSWSWCWWSSTKTSKCEEWMMESPNVLGIFLFDMAKNKITKSC